MSVKQSMILDKPWYNTSMNEDEPVAESYERPVAYGADGQPLYAHPSVVAHPEAAPAVAADTNSDKVKSDVSLETKLKHDTSRRYYPSLNLRNDEYVISAIRRHPIGLFLPFTIGVVMMAFLLSILLNYDLFVRIFNITGPAAQASTMALPMLLVAILIAIGVYINYYVYTSNRLYLTNECVIQEVQVSLFSHVEQTVSLDNIEDASYQQKGLFQQFFDYGSIRLSTEGNATSYRFTYAAHPKEHIDVLNNAIEALRNSRANSNNR